MSSLERTTIAQQFDEVPNHRNRQWETDSSASESETSIADGKEEIFERRGVEFKEEMENVAVAAEREKSIFEREVAEVSVADRI